MKQRTAFLLLILLVTPLAAQAMGERLLQEDPALPACPTNCICGWGELAPPAPARILAAADNNGMVCTACINPKTHYFKAAVMSPSAMPASCVAYANNILWADDTGLPTVCASGFTVHAGSKSCCPWQCDCDNSGACTACSAAATALAYSFASGACTYSTALTPCDANCHCTAGTPPVCAECRVPLGFKYIPLVAANPPTVPADVPASCVACPANCGVCSDAMTCTTCKTGFWKNGSGVCEACSANCATCNPADGKCTSCAMPRKYLTTPAGTCDSCGTGCEGCSSATSCKAGCAPKWFAVAPTSPATNVCTACSLAGCAYCSVADSCVTCKTGFFKVAPVSPATASTCTACLENCSKCDNATECTTCKTDFMLSADKKKCEGATGLSTGAIVGIAIGSAAAVVLIVGVILYLKKGSAAAAATTTAAKK